MAGFKRSQPGLRFSSEKVTPDEQDEYVNYTIALPGTASAFFGTAVVGGTSAVTAVVVVNRYPDYPRNINFSLAGSAAGMAGTLVYNAFDQFGSVFQETIATGTASNGGTALGTKIVASFTSGTISYGTAVGGGTPSVGFVPGTGCLFGLPVKIGSATDVVFLSMNAGTGAITYNGGTVAGFVNTAQHAIRPAATLTGTQVINAWVVSSFVPDNIPFVSNLKQAV